MFKHRVMWNVLGFLTSCFTQGLLLLAMSTLLACQSSPHTTVKNHSLQPKRVHQLPQLQVAKSTDGVQDINWQITLIQNKHALFFNQYPSFNLHSVAKTVSGHTGCNSVYGRYHYNFAQRRLDFDVMAGYDSCNRALAQEADLMDALQRVKYFQFDGAVLYLIDERGQRLIQAQRRSQ